MVRVNLVPRIIWKGPRQDGRQIQNGGGKFFGQPPPGPFALAILNLAAIFPQPLANDPGDELGKESCSYLQQTAKLYIQSSQALD